MASVASTASEIRDRDHLSGAEPDGMVPDDLKTLLSLAAAFASGYGAHFWAAKRDRRRDFNAAGDQIRAILIPQLTKLTPSSELPTAVDLERVTAWMSGRHARKLSALLIEYEKQRHAARNKDTSGGAYYNVDDVQSIIKTVEKILHLLKRR